MYLTTILLFIKRFPHIIIHFSVFQNILIKTTETNIVTFYAFLTDISVIKKIVHGIKYNGSTLEMTWETILRLMFWKLILNVKNVEKVPARFML